MEPPVPRKQRSSIATIPSKHKKANDDVRVSPGKILPEEKKNRRQICLRNERLRMIICSD
jgi:hypothetical protein